MKNKSQFNALFTPNKADPFGARFPFYGMTRSMMFWEKRNRIWLLRRMGRTNGRTQVGFEFFRVLDQTQHESTGVDNREGRREDRGPPAQQNRSIFCPHFWHSERISHFLLRRSLPNFYPR